MAVAEMRKVTIVGHQSLLDSVMSSLQRLNIVQVVDVAETLEAYEDYFRGAPVPDNATQQGLEGEAAQVRSAIALLDEHFKVKKGIIETFSGVRYALPEADYRRRAEGGDEVEPLLAQAQEMKTRLTEIDAQRSAIRDRLALLRPWQALEVPVDEVQDTRLFRLQLGEIAGSAAEQLSQELAEVTGAAGYHLVSEARDKLHVLLYYPKRQGEEVGPLLRRAEWTPASLPSVAGTAATEIERLTTLQETLAEEQRAAMAAVQSLVEERLTLYAREDELRNQLDRESAKQMLALTERLFVLRGWMRAKDAHRLEAAMAELSPALVVEHRPPDAGEDHPVDLENGPVVRPFEVVTRTAGLPIPGALDPTPYLSPFFFIFFGLCLGDAGYGILLSILSLWLVKRAKAVGMGRQLLYMMAICGISTVIAGALTGSWFGDLFGLPALWFNPMDNPLPMLALSVGLGVLQILSALGIKAYDNMRKGHLLDALFDQVLWIVFLLGLVLLLVGGSLEQLAGLGALAKYLALGGAIGLVLTQGRHQRNPIKRLLSGLLSLYGVSGYMSDALSYSRLLALGMASGVVAMVLNDAARRLLGIPFVGWLLMGMILVGGHLFNLAINLVSAYVHSSRLQYVEFFTKFLEAGGKPFKPLAERHKYLVVEPDATSSSER